MKIKDKVKDERIQRVPCERHDLGKLERWHRTGWWKHVGSRLRKGTRSHPNDQGLGYRSCSCIGLKRWAGPQMGLECKCDLPFVEAECGYLSWSLRDH